MICMRNAVVPADMCKARRTVPPPYAGISQRELLAIYTLISKSHPSLCRILPYAELLKVLFPTGIQTIADEERRATAGGPLRLVQGLVLGFTTLLAQRVLLALLLRDCLPCWPPEQGLAETVYAAAHASPPPHVTEAHKCSEGQQNRQQDSGVSVEVRRSPAGVDKPGDKPQPQQSNPGTDQGAVVHCNLTATAAMTPARAATVDGCVAPEGSPAVQLSEASAEGQEAHTTTPVRDLVASVFSGALLTTPSSSGPTSSATTASSSHLPLQVAGLHTGGCIGRHFAVDGYAQSCGRRLLLDTCR